MRTFALIVGFLCTTMAALDVAFGLYGWAAVNAVLGYWNLHQGLKD